MKWRVGRAVISTGEEDEDVACRLTHVDLQARCDLRASEARGVLAGGEGPRQLSPRLRCSPLAARGCTRC